MSQNFLIDGNIIRKIIRVSHVQPGDLVVEIGSGPGSLTQGLLESGAHVIAVEMDPVLAKALERLQTPDNRLEVFCEDILAFPLADTLTKRLEKGKKAQVTANLPYHLTSPILAMLMPMENLISSLTVMVQEEMAQRMTSPPGNKDYSSFSVFLNFYSHPEYAFGVSRNCFYPAPKVDSAIVKLNLRDPPLKEHIDAFFKMTRTAFEHRRKMLRASLKDLYSSDSVTKALEAIGQSPLARPEVLSLDDFLKMFHILNA